MGNRIFVILSIVLLMVAIVGYLCQIAVMSAAKNRMYTDVDKIPFRKFGLLLGTSPIGRTGRPNQFFNRRIDATVELWKAGKIGHIIISGAHHDEEYNEPEEMRVALTSRGIPDSILTLDGKGYRTILSVTRAKNVFGVDSMTIISQEFHNERALFLAKHQNIDAIAYNAGNTSSQRWQLRMIIREYLARTKAVMEVMF